MHLSKAGIHGRSHQEDHIDWVSETLLVNNLVSRPGVFLVDDAPVVSHLNFMADLRSVGITSAHQKFARAEPAWIKVAHLSFDSIVHLSDVLVPWP